MLVDSNIIIYAAQPGNDALRRYIAENLPFVSAISYVEVLGYHRLLNEEKLALQQFFASAVVLPITQTVLASAVALRQQRRMTLGDALIAATCLVHNLTLVTRNVSDFAWIADLSVLDPFSESLGLGKEE